MMRRSVLAAIAALAVVLVLLVVTVCSRPQAQTQPAGQTGGQVVTFTYGATVVATAVCPPAPQECRVASR